jgi:hypothetical protein
MKKVEMKISSKKSDGVCKLFHKIQWKTKKNNGFPFKNQGATMI